MRGYSIGRLSPKEDCMSGVCLIEGVHAISTSATSREGFRGSQNGSQIQIKVM